MTYDTTTLDAAIEAAEDATEGMPCLGNISNHDRTYARALIAKLIEGMWQPADTAPRGQWLLTCREGETCSTIAMRGFGGEWLSPSGHTTVTSHAYLPPTHWQPLPAPFKEPTP